MRGFIRLGLDIVLVGGLLYLGWEIPFQKRLPWNTDRPKPATIPVQHAIAPTVAPVVRYNATPAPTASGQWMWDPARRSALDRPAYDSKDKSQRYLDAEGRRFWLDGNGVRHYDP